MPEIGVGAQAADRMPSPNTEPIIGAPSCVRAPLFVIFRLHSHDLTGDGTGFPAREANRSQLHGHRSVHGGGDATSSLVAEIKRQLAQTFNGCRTQLRAKWLPCMGRFFPRFLKRSSFLLLRMDRQPAQVHHCVMSIVGVFLWELGRSPLFLATNSPRVRSVLIGGTAFGRLSSFASRSRG